MRSIATTDVDPLLDRLQTQSRLRIPHHLPPSISRYVISVTEPEDILKHFQSRRERNYHLLIRRFIYQILYGCTNPACNVITCLSYQRRTTKTPLRKLTPLSARTLACYLASASNPEAALCPNRPQVSHEHEPSALKRRPRRKSHNVTFESTGQPVDNASAQQSEVNGDVTGVVKGQSRPGVLVRPAHDSSGSGYGHSDGLVNEQGHIAGRGRRRPGAKPVDRSARDPKSFTQSLFETLPLRMLEWLPFQRKRASSSGDPSLSSCEGPYRQDDGAEVLAESPANKHTESPGNIADAEALPASLQKPFEHGGPAGILKVTGKDLPKSSDSGMGYTVESQPSKILNDVERARTMPQGNTGSISVAEHGSELSSLGDSILRQKPLYAPLPVELRQGVVDSRSSRQPQTSHYDSTNDEPATRGSLHQPASEIGSTSEAHYGDETNADAHTYTLERVSLDALTDLRLIQESLEKRCLGYHFTGHRPWHDDSKPEEKDLAVLFSDWSDFTKQCCFYLLKDSSRLAQAFEWEPRPDQGSDSAAWPTSILPQSGFKIFTSLFRLLPSAQIFQFLSYSLDQVFLSPSQVARSLRNQSLLDPNRKDLFSTTQSQDSAPQELSNNQAAFICAVMLYALARFTAIHFTCNHPGHVDLSWRRFCQIRSTGRILPAEAVGVHGDAQGLNCHPAHLAHLQSLTDVFENEHALELVSKLAKAVTNRLTFSEISSTRGKCEHSKKTKSVLQLLIQHLKEFISRGSWPSNRAKPISLSSTTLEWLRTIVLRNWDGQAVIQRAGTVGAAFQILAAMHEQRSDLQLEDDAFHTPFFAERLDSMEMPVHWLSYHPNNKTFHMLSYSFLFPPSALVTYFRALNFAAMSRSFESALITSRHVSQFAYSETIPIANDVELLTTMRPAMATYLVLNVRRDNVLTDAMNQLWRRQKRELMRPLKVRLGLDEGEEGVDHGGVQQEFFQCVFAEALSPAYGMFTVDEKTRMTWFQPCSLEPLYKFEMLGILFSIAVYNSITLPITFPTAFYRRLLNLPVKKLSHIQDGWPDLAKGLQELLDWTEGDVEDVFMRSYHFSFDLFGRPVDVDMHGDSRNDAWPVSAEEKLHQPNKANEPQRPPSKPSSPKGSTPDSASTDSSQDHQSILTPLTNSTTTEGNPPLVTNRTRKQYVKDYIFWLTSKSISPQFSAFLHGFHTCLTPTALSIFNPSALQSVIEGSQHIDIDELESITRYEDGYDADTAVIRWFWEAVRAFEPEKRRALLEFVTASDRVPVSGLRGGNVAFAVQRSGDDDQRLPTSMTCFGKLLLPEYSSREVLGRKLEKALQNARGFGVA